MGLIDFVKEAGESLFGGAKPEEPKGQEALSKRVQDLGVSVDGLRVEMDGDRAVLSGKARTQADREKAVLAIGNTPGIAQVDERIEVSEPAPESQYYKVKSGDTLSKIAKQYYGAASKYPTLFEANRPMLKDPDAIYPGQVLRIPPLQEAAGARR